MSMMKSVKKVKPVKKPDHNCYDHRENYEIRPGIVYCFTCGAEVRLNY